MRVFIISAFILLQITALVSGDFRIGRYTLLKNKHDKQNERNKKEDNEAIREQLNEYFATVDPIDLKYGIPKDQATLDLSKHLLISAELENLYKEGDKNHDGKLSIDEMKEMVEKRHLLTEKELDDLLKAADTNNDGALSPEELASYIAHKELNIENVNTDFNRDKARLIDLNKDGYIEMEEFQRMFRFCNQNFNRLLIEMIINVGDQNKDKQLSYKAGGEEKPEENALKRIKGCMERFIEKCKNGFCNRRLNKTRASVKDLFKLFFMSWK